MSTGTIEVPEYVLKRHPGTRAEDWDRTPTGAWVHIRARVFPRAILGHGATIGLDVIVGIRARIGCGAVIRARGLICEGVRIMQGVWTREGAEWDSTPLQIQGPRAVAAHSGPGRMSIGCVDLPFVQWRRRLAAIGERHGYTPEEVDRYRRILGWIEEEDARRFPNRDGGDA